jgi:hypothetical protein
MVSLLPFAELIRFYLHQNFSVVIIGSFLFSTPTSVVDHLVTLAKLYLSFNVCLYVGSSSSTSSPHSNSHDVARKARVHAIDTCCTSLRCVLHTYACIARPPHRCPRAEPSPSLPSARALALPPPRYGGIYTLNAVTDMEEDKAHPVKCQRPVPRGAVSPTAALFFTAFLWCSAFLSTYLMHGYVKGHSSSRIGYQRKGTGHRAPDSRYLARPPGSIKWGQSIIWGSLMGPRRRPPPPLHLRWGQSLRQAAVHLAVHVGMHQ